MPSNPLLGFTTLPRIATLRSRFGSTVVATVTFGCSTTGAGVFAGVVVTAGKRIGLPVIRKGMRTLSQVSKCLLRRENSRNQGGFR
jgi:hypothetical protein